MSKKAPKQMTFEEAMDVWKKMPKTQQVVLRKLAVRNMIDRGCEEIGTSDVNWEVYSIIKNEDYKTLVESFKEKVPFGDLKEGDIFCLSSGHPEYGKKYLNVKMHGFGVFRGMDGKTKTEFEDSPFNVVELGTGRQRTFRNDEMVFKVTIKANPFEEIGT